MPKPSVAKVSQLRSFATEFERETLVYEKYSLICRGCGVVLGVADSNMKRSQVTQHIATVKHQKLLDLYKKQKKLNFEADTFHRELCEAFLGADIPLYKLRNEKLTSFLEKYTGQVMPSESLVRTKYVDKCYSATLDEIRKEIKNGPIWVCIDETTDKEYRQIANVIVGRLDSEIPNKVFLLDTVQLQKTNSDTIVDLFHNSLSILWPSGVLREQVFLFISDAAPYMMKAGKILKSFYTRMLRITCVVHALHRVAEKVRSLYSKVDSFIALMKSIFQKAPSRITLFKEMFPNLSLPPKPILIRWGMWLTAAKYYAKNYHSVMSVVDALDGEDSQAIAKVKKLCEKKGSQLIVDLATIQQSYVFIVDSITHLEKNGMSLKDSFEIVNEATNRLKIVPNSEVILKTAQVLSKNPDLRFLRALVNKDVETIATCPQFKKMTPAELASFAYAPIVSCEVERSFSAYKSTLRDNRRSFLFENLKMHLVIGAFSKE